MAAIAPPPVTTESTVTTVAVKPLDTQSTTQASSDSKKTALTVTVNEVHEDEQKKAAKPAPAAPEGFKLVKVRKPDGTIVTVKRPINKDVKKEDVKKVDSAPAPNSESKTASAATTPASTATKPADTSKPTSVASQPAAPAVAPAASKSQAQDAPASSPSAATKPAAILSTASKTLSGVVTTANVNKALQAVSAENINHKLSLGNHLLNLGRAVATGDLDKFSELATKGLPQKPAAKTPAPNAKGQPKSAPIPKAPAQGATTDKGAILTKPISIAGFNKALSTVNQLQAVCQGHKSIADVTNSLAQTVTTAATKTTSPAAAIVAGKASTTSTTASTLSTKQIVNQPKQVPTMAAAGTPGRAADAKTQSTVVNKQTSVTIPAKPGQSAASNKAAPSSGAHAPVQALGPHPSSETSRSIDGTQLHSNSPGPVQAPHYLPQSGSAYGQALHGQAPYGQAPPHYASQPAYGQASYGQPQYPHGMQAPHYDAQHFAGASSAHGTASGISRLAQNPLAVMGAAAATTAAVTMGGEALYSHFTEERGNAEAGRTPAPQTQSDQNNYSHSAPNHQSAPQHDAQPPHGQVSEHSQYTTQPQQGPNAMAHEKAAPSNLPVSHQQQAAGQYQRVPQGAERGAPQHDGSNMDALGGAAAGGITGAGAGFAAEHYAGAQDEDDGIEEWDPSDEGQELGDHEYGNEVAGEDDGIEEYDPTMDEVVDEQGDENDALEQHRAAVEEGETGEELEEYNPEEDEELEEYQPGEDEELEVGDEQHPEAGVEHDDDGEEGEEEHYQQEQDGNYEQEDEHDGYEGHDQYEQDEPGYGDGGDGGDDY